MKYFLAFVVGLALAWIFGPFILPAPSQELRNTNPPEIRKWFETLQNHMGGSCCGEADGYPAAIDEEATPTHIGRGHVLDPSAKEIWVNGVHLKTRPKLSGDLTFEFTYNQVTKEQQGNPFGYAYVFVNTVDDGNGNFHINKASGLWQGIYCVVPLPNIF